MKKIIAFVVAFLLPTVLFAQANCDEPEPMGYFIRGDVNNDGEVTLVTDWTYLNNYLWQGGDPPCNMDAADVNDDGEIDISDQIALQNWFIGQFEIPAPYPDMGDDETGDFLANETSSKPGGDGYKMPTGAREIGETGSMGVCGGSEEGQIPNMPNLQRFDITSEGRDPQNPGDVKVRRLYSQNIVCHYSDPYTYDWFDSKWCFDISSAVPQSQQFDDAHHPGHLTKWALDNARAISGDKHKVKLRIKFHYIVHGTIDCVCGGSTEGTNLIEASLGSMFSTKAKLVVNLKNMTQSGKDYQLVKNLPWQRLGPPKYVTWSGGTCFGEGDLDSTGYKLWDLDGSTVYGFSASGADEMDIMKVESVEVQGIMHRAGGSVEISCLDSLTSKVKIEVKYEWRKDGKDPSEIPF